MSPAAPKGRPAPTSRPPRAGKKPPAVRRSRSPSLDSGVDLAHPDLKNKIAGPGKDFVNDDLNASDDFFHGTAVAGIAAAETDNNEGIAGVAWKAKILPVKVLDAYGLGTAERRGRGIRWAADQGAQVINFSLGFDDTELTLLNRGPIRVR